ncbi:MAG: peptidase domain-containing ABC transporter, partial [Proteobacteria bacterium]
MILGFFGNASNRLPVIIQSEVNECGLACLAMIASYHGHDINLAALRRRFPVSVRGITLKQLIEIGSKLQLNARPLKLEMAHLQDIQKPCILHWEMNHFVVLKSIRRNKIFIHDPGRGELSFTYEEFSKGFTGIALELNPITEFMPIIDKPKLNIKQLFGHIKGSHNSLILVFILSLILMALSISMPIFTQLVFDEVLGGGDLQLLKLLMLGLAVVVLFRSVVGLVRGLLLLFVGNLLSFHASSSVFSKLLMLPMKFFSSRHIGDVVSRFGSLEQIKSFLTQGLVEVGVDGVMTIMMLLFMMIYSVPLGFIAIGTIVVYGTIRYFSIATVKRLSEEAIVSQAKEQSNFMETIRGIQSIKLYGGESDRHNLWQNNYVRALNANASLGRYRIGFQSIKELLFGIEKAVIIYVGVQLVFEREFSPGMLIAFLAYKDQFSEKVSTLIENAIQFKLLNLHLDRLSDIVLETNELTRDDSDVALEITGSLELINLSYQHDLQSPYIFKDLTLQISAGECISIIGPSGCGKTTLLRLLVGLTSPTCGSVRVDGIDVSQTRESYQKQIATVMQDDHLLSGSIIENIAFFEPSPNMELIYLCAMRAQIHIDILAMPMKYNSLIGDMGSSLSGGQKQ